MDRAVPEQDRAEYGKLRVAGHVLLGDHRRRYHLGHAVAVPAGGRGRPIDQVTGADGFAAVISRRRRVRYRAITRTALSGRSSTPGRGSSQAKTADAAE